jgi:hypothetical protein
MAGSGIDPKGAPMRKLRSRMPSPAMVVAVIALVAAVGGTAYAAHQISGNLIKKHTIGGSKLKKDTLTGYQIKNSKLGIVPVAKRAAHTYWAVVHNENGNGNATLVRASDPGMAVAESGGVVNVQFPVNMLGCANVAGRNNAGTSAPGAGFAQTNVSAANNNTLEVRTRNDAGANVDADFHVIAVCP